MDLLAALIITTHGKASADQAWLANLK